MKKQIKFNIIWTNAMSYGKYKSQIEDSLQQNNSTKNALNEELVAFTKLNVHRMMSLEKRLELDQQAVKSFRTLPKSIGLLILTEGWCGDAAQILPVVEQLCVAAGVKSKYILRDAHPDVMDQFLTNGARSIPIVIFLNLETLDPIGSWGPRPKPAQELVKTYKQLKEPRPPKDDLHKSIQLWYRNDRQRTIQQELGIFAKVLLNAAKGD